jgi:aspartyl-tRNA(Asn)/glutamyl-tRNA(Gln) amidotransferase subunit A
VHALTSHAPEPWAVAALDGRLNAFSSLGPPLAGADGGPLAGTTFAAKENFDVAGELTPCGCDAPPFAPASRHAQAVSALLGAGLSFVGRTRMPQFAFGGWGTNALAPEPRNPWDADVYRVSGGSSSGSAVAVAAGMVDLALGSDTGGSARIPAALCGVVGFKPSERRVPPTGLRPLSPTLDVVGLLGGRVAHVAGAFERIAIPVRAERWGGVASARIAVAEWPREVRVQRDVGDAFERAVTVLGQLVGRVGKAPLPWDPQELVTEHGTILGFEAARLYGPLLERPAFRWDPPVQRRVLAGLGVGVDRYVTALHRRLDHQREYYALASDVDVVVTPTTPITAPPRDAVDEGSLVLSTFTRLANYLDLAAVSVPCGFDAGGLPIGLQLLALPGREMELLALAAEYEAATGWHLHRPPLHVQSRLSARA